MMKSDYHALHYEGMDLNKDGIDKVQSNLTELGYAESDIWKLMRGHNLWNTIIKPLIVEELNQKVNDGIREQRETGQQVDKVKVMNELGITTSVREYVDYEFYYGDMAEIEMPTLTIEKLDKIFPMS